MKHRLLRLTLLTAAPASCRICNSFVSTNGHVLGTNDINITMGMEPTACLEVQVLDDKGNALKDAQVSAWPNLCYCEWAATILTGDCYNMAAVHRLRGYSSIGTSLGKRSKNYCGGLRVGTGNPGGIERQGIEDEFSGYIRDFAKQQVTRQNSEF